MKKYVILLFCLILYSCNKTGFKKSIINRHYNTPIVELKINGHDYNFIIDTGSELSFIDDKIVHNTIVDSIYMSTCNFNGSFNSDKFYIANVVLNDSIKTKMYTMNIENIQENIFLKSGLIIHGIIGSDILSEEKVIIDYKNKILIFN